MTTMNAGIMFELRNSLAHRATSSEFQRRGNFLEARRAQTTVSICWTLLHSQPVGLLHTTAKYHINAAAVHASAQLLRHTGSQNRNWRGDQQLQQTTGSYTKFNICATRIKNEQTRSREQHVHTVETTKKRHHEMTDKFQDYRLARL